MKRVILIGLLLILPLISSLNENQICDRAYNFVVSNNWNFSNAQIEQINKELGISNFSEYLEKPYTLCVSKKYTNDFPEKSTNRIYINNTEKKESCNFEISSIFGDSVPILQFNLGKTPCFPTKIVNYFFRVEEDKKDFVSKGIRPFSFVYLLAIIFISMWIKKVKFIKGKDFNKQRK